jgi:methylenetetrahydrofolate dehydrogenase (NADP+) / methenyltetrahydrofolate cyclohydrolase
MESNIFPPWQWGQTIRGSKIANDVVSRLSEQYADQIKANPDQKVVIFQFEKPPVSHFSSEEDARLLTQYYAANDSTVAKIKTFERLGVQVESHQNLSWQVPVEDFAQQIQALVNDENIRAFVVQNPMPAACASYLREANLGGKDIDAQSRTSNHPNPATSDAINRVIQPILDGDVNLTLDSTTRALDKVLDQAGTPLNVVVVGAEGNIGKAVVAHLENRSEAITVPIEQGDMQFESKLEAADIIVSAAGRPALLTEQHIKPHHQLVVDCGYAPQITFNPETQQEEVTARLGDVARSAYGIAQNITPVPGGTGPMEMAVLAERYIQKEFDPNLPPWQLQQHCQLQTFDRDQVATMQQQWAKEIYPIAAQQFDQGVERDNPAQPGIFIVNTDNGYRLTVDRGERTFSIQGPGRRGELAKFQFEGQQPQLVHATGLAGSDVQKFQQLQVQAVNTSPARSNQPER